MSAEKLTISFLLSSFFSLGHPRKMFTWSASIQHHMDNLSHEYKTVSEKLMMPDVSHLFSLKYSLI